MKTYEAMRQTHPHFFIHSGDNVYADGPMLPEVTDSSGAVIWQNAFLDVVPEKLKVAETLDEFRRNYLYNRYDANLCAFSAEVPQIWQWDDHEVTNNWSPSKVLDARYTEKDIFVLVERATQAFHEYAPSRPFRGDAAGRVYRHVAYGPDLDIFVLDMRSYRAGNSCNVRPAPGPETQFLGSEQRAWLKRKLSSSRATWKIIASDMPLGLVVGDGTDPVTACPRYENSSNGNGPVLGREFEIAELLRFIKQRNIENVVWLTADVHYAAAHYYDQSVAQFEDFNSFWEFVSGPLHAGTFGPNALDDTFGPTVIFQKAPPAGQSNLPPSAGLQFFGQVDLDPRHKSLTVSFKDQSGALVFAQELSPGMKW
jgi:alkaline phosphatase D